MERLKCVKVKGKIGTPHAGAKAGMKLRLDRFRSQLVPFSLS